jgi:hypothetical protein
MIGRLLAVLRLVYLIMMLAIWVRLCKVHKYLTLPTERAMPAWNDWCFPQGIPQAPHSGGCRVPRHL